MVNKINTGSDELNIAIAEFVNDSTEEKYFAVLAALAESSGMVVLFLVASSGYV